MQDIEVTQLSFLKTQIKHLQDRVAQLENETKDLKQNQQIVYHKHSWESGAGGCLGYSYTTRPAAEGSMGWSTTQGNTSPI